MNDLHTAEAAADEVARRILLGVDPDAPPYARAAATAYFTELDDLLAHLAAYPAERWVAYHGGRRVGFGSNPPEFSRACHERFPDGRCLIYLIDAVDKYPGDTVV